MANMAQDKFSALNALTQREQETNLESESRKAAEFSDTEEKLGKCFARTDMDLLDKATSLLGSYNPFGRQANPKDHEVWLLDNTAYRPVDEKTGKVEPWQAEFVACFFNKGRKDIGKAVSNLADIIGLDGKVGDDEAAKKRIEQRIQPFINAIAPARTIEISIPSPGAEGAPQKRTLGPSNSNGISSQLLSTGGADNADGSTVSYTTENNLFPDLKGQLRFVGPEGWAIISDIDDTIKVTMTPSPVGTLKSTFADIPKTTTGIPEFYKVLEEQFKSPAWFYLSASPYNLYPFLHKYINENYTPGTIILRDASWMYFGGLLQSLTQGVQAYKTSRIQKIHSWLPKRKFICIGDSTQSDPESYGEMYRKYPGWIKAIYIRKVTDAPYMEKKNKDQRFKDAFKDVPDAIWRVFTDPAELSDHVKTVVAGGSLT